MDFYYAWSIFAIIICTIGLIICIYGFYHIYRTGKFLKAYLDEEGRFISKRISEDKGYDGFHKYDALGDINKRRVSPYATCSAIYNLLYNGNRLCGYIWHSLSCYIARGRIVVWTSVIPLSSLVLNYGLWHRYGSFGHHCLEVA